MAKRLFPLLLSLLWLMPTLSVSAQQAEWNAWLYNRDEGRMIHINSSGELLDDFVLFLPADFDVYSYNVAVSPTGNHTAYKIYSSGSFITRLHVYDRVNNGLTIYPAGQIVGDSLDFLGASQAFNEQESDYAYGYGMEGEGWRVVVIDLSTAREVFTLRWDEPMVASVGAPTEFGYTPVVQRYRNGEITFTLISQGSGEVGANTTFTWNPVLNSLRPSLAFFNVTGDINPATGETISPMMDSRLENTVNNLPIPFQQNTLQIFDPTSGARYPVFNSGTWNINAAYFIQNGQRVVVNAFDVTDTTQDDPRFWAVVNRDSTVSSFLGFMPADVQSVKGAPDGFVYTLGLEDANGITTTLMHVRTNDETFTTRPVWQGESGAEWRVMWTMGSDATFSAQAVEAWAQLAPPVYDAGATISPSALPTRTPFAGGSATLTIGGQATVNTTEGDQLNVRSGAGREFEIVAKLVDGTRVIILEGPTFGNGLTWWRVRTSVGVEGWVVESVEGIRTLIP